MDSPFNINLDAYQGPLDILLDLIRKQEIDIYNIPIHKITAQYLDIIHQRPDLDIEAGGEFVFMASTLIHIKSKMLLPADPLAGPEEQLDPRDELVHRLLEHEKFKNAAQMLYQKQQIEAHVWSKPDLTLYDTAETEGEVIVSLVDIVKVFQQVLERRREVVKIELHHEQFTVAQMMELLRKQLVTNDDGVDLAAFFESCASRHAMIVAFLAVLELVRLQAIILTQAKLFEAILLRKHKMFDVVFSGGEGAEPLRAIDEQYQ
jgi:segregation and condensation protein A